MTQLELRHRLLNVIIYPYGRSRRHLYSSRCRGRCWRGRPSTLTDESKWPNSKRWIILWKPKQELPPFETVMGSDEISLLFMRNSQLTFVPSASAKPPPTSRTTFHGMAAWNSPQEIMASSWREIKTHPAHIFTSTDSCCPTTPADTCSEHSWLWFHYHGRNTQLQWRKKCLCMYVCTEFIYRMFWRVRRQVRWRRGDPAAEPRWHQWCSRSDWWRQEQKKLIYWQLSVRLQPVHDINHRNVLKLLFSVGSDSLREERSPARHETWRSGQPQQHHHQENSPSEHLLRAGRQKQGERMNKWVIEGWKSR